MSHHGMSTWSKAERAPGMMLKIKYNQKERVWEVPSITSRPHPLRHLPASCILPRLCAMWPFLHGIQIFRSGFCVSSRGQGSSMISSLSNILDLTRYPPSEELSRWALDLLMWFKRLRGEEGYLSTGKQRFLITVTTGDVAQQSVGEQNKTGGTGCYFALPAFHAWCFLQRTCFQFNIRAHKCTNDFRRRRNTWLLELMNVKIFVIPAE